MLSAHEMTSSASIRRASLTMFSDAARRTSLSGSLVRAYRCGKRWCVMTL